MTPYLHRPGVRTNELALNNNGETLFPLVLSMNKKCSPQRNNTCLTFLYARI